MSLVELLKRATVMVIFHCNPATEPIPTPAFLTVYGDGILTTIWWHPNTTIL